MQIGWGEPSAYRGGETVATVRPLPSMPPRPPHVFMMQAQFHSEVLTINSAYSLFTLVSRIYMRNSTLLRPNYPLTHSLTHLQVDRNRLTAEVLLFALCVTYEPSTVRISLLTFSTGVSLLLYRQGRQHDPGTWGGVSQRHGVYPQQPEGPTTSFQRRVDAQLSRNTGSRLTPKNVHWNTMVSRRTQTQ